MAEAINFILEQMGTSSRPQPLTILYQFMFFHLVTKFVDIMRISAGVLTANPINFPRDDLS